ncbi:MAG: DUF2304 domain-containing protein [Parcubacteria group bacterium]|nr:DUF2304 domain-containing protein [Parcubacteria group bacterium]
MRPIQVLLLFFVFLFFGKLYAQRKKNRISGREYVFAILFFALSVVAIVIPDTTSYFAAFVGVGRGVDLILYIAVLSIFYTMFKLFIRLFRLEQSLSRLVSELAILRSQENDGEKQEIDKKV